MDENGALPSAAWEQALDNRGLAYSFVGWSRGMPQHDDLVQAALIGLAIGTDLFDEANGFSFSSSVRWSIRSEIKRERRAQRGRNRHIAAERGERFAEVSIDKPIVNTGPAAYANVTGVKTHTDTFASKDNVEVDAIAAVTVEEYTAALMLCCRDQLDRAIVDGMLDGWDLGTGTRIAEQYGVTRAAVSARRVKIRGRFAAYIEGEHR